MLEVEDLSFKYTDSLILNHANLRLFLHDHAVLVGKNGMGKSTLMKLINKDLIPDSGRVTWLPNIKYGYMDQYLKIFDNLTVEVYLYDTYDRLFKLEEELNKYYIKLGEVPENEYDRIYNHINIITEELERNDFYNIKTKIDNVLVGLGLLGLDLNTPIYQLSGGMKAKIFLAKLLLMDADCILLDEPTNFLDVAHVTYLANYLKNYKKSFLVISHDVEFIKQIATTVFELKDGKIERYNGDYEFYLREKDIRAQNYLNEFKRQEKFIKETKEFISKNIVRASTTARAQSRRKMLEKLHILERPKGDAKVKIDFKLSGRIGEDVLVCDNLVIGYDKPLLEPISFTIRHNEKVAITGRNGIGKSTLLKTLIGQIDSLGGSFKFSPSAKILYYKQEETYPHIKPIPYVRSFYPSYDDNKIRSLLARKGLLADSINKDCDTLSGGEKTKLTLAILEEVPCNLLILDEPTNHLDIDAKRELYRAINEFDSSVILVTHEREFYEAICDYEISLEVLKK